MRVWRHLDEMPADARGAVVTIGNFDGIHLGHQKIIAEVCRRARSAGAPAMVMTFDPHPTHIVAPERAPRLLTPLSVKLELLAQLGMQQVLVLPFTERFSQIQPEQFARDILAERLGVTRVIVGDNFRFGHRHAGDVATLAKFGNSLGFDVEAVTALKMRGQTVSSSRIRQLLIEGRVSMANRLLGRCFSVRGRIVPGRGIGKTKTVPTMNLEQYDELLPRTGVYVTETASDGVKAISVTNVGYSPTFEPTSLRVESFLLEGTPPPVVQEMEVSFWYRLRDEREFPSAEALKAQILRDVGASKAFFRRLRKPQTARR